MFQCSGCQKSITHLLNVCLVGGVLLLLLAIVTLPTSPSFLYSLKTNDKLL